MPWFSPSVESVQRRIWKAWRRNEAERAEQIAEAFTRNRPDDPRSRVIWGNLVFKRGDHPAAERILREGFALHPDADPDLGWLLARAVGAQGRTAEARELLEDQIKVFPGSRLPYLGLLNLAVGSKDWLEASRLAEETLARTPMGDNAGKYEVAVQLVQMPGRLEEGISLLRQVVDIAIEPGPSLLLLGAVLERARHPEAQTFLDRARAAWKSPTPFGSALAGTRAYVEKLVPDS